MFSGIVQEMATIKKISGSEILRIDVQLAQASKCRLGDSVAINGVCLTVVHIDLNHNVLSFEAVAETLSKTNLGQLKVAEKVNAELSLRFGDFVGGHLVQGHVDGVANIRFIQQHADSWIVGFTTPSEILKYLVTKGFVTIDGMSITVIDVLDAYFTVTFIPHTIENTIVKNYAIGNTVNIEADPIGKQIHQYMDKYNHV